MSRAYPTHPDACPCSGCYHSDVVEGTERRVQHQTVNALVDHLRHEASGYGLLRTLKADAVRDALYRIAGKLEKDWQSVVLPRMPSSSTERVLACGMCDDPLSVPGEIHRTFGLLYCSKGCADGARAAHAEAQRSSEADDSVPAMSFTSDLMATIAADDDEYPWRAPDDGLWIRAGCLDCDRDHGPCEAHNLKKVRQ